MKARQFGLYRLWVLLLGLVPVMSIAASLFDDNEARRQIAAERLRVDDLRSQSAQHQAQQQAMEQRLARIEESMRGQPLLDLFSQIESLRLEINRLRGQIEVLNNSIETTTRRQRDMYQDLDTRLRRIEQTPATGAGQTPSSVAAPTQPVPAAIANPVSPPSTAPAATVTVKPAAQPPLIVAADNSPETRAYEAAQSLRRNGNYQGAIVSFQNFIKQYPRSSLAPRAQYWIGDSYFNLRDYKLAISSQQALIGAYPDSPTLPDALLNIASSQIELGEASVGRKTLEDLVAKFPISDAADKAKRRLAALAPAKP